MGKRSDFERRDRNYYPTPESATWPLLRFVPEGIWFDEPCAGNTALTLALQKHGLHCTMMTDIEPQVQGIRKRDALERSRCYGNMFITNPPWPMPGQGGDPSVSIALHLSSIAPTWLLLSADFAHNKYFNKLADRCVKIVSVGRVSWMENGTSGKDNCAWYLFDANHQGQTAFIGRAA